MKLKCDEPLPKVAFKFNLRRYIMVFARSDASLVMHWAAADRPGAEWKPPPHGWRTAPEKSWESGGASWETEFERIEGGWQAGTHTRPLFGST